MLLSNKLWMIITFIIPSLINSYSVTIPDTKDYDIDDKNYFHNEMKETVRDMLNYKKIPDSTKTYSRKVTSPAGKYMLALFDKYTKNAIANLSYSETNIIRSFNPNLHLRDIRFKDSLVFNITTIDKDEDILKAHLYIYQKHLPRNLFNYRIPDVVSVDSDGFELTFKGKKLEHNLFFWNVTISLKTAKFQGNNYLVLVFKKDSKYVPLRNIIHTNTPFLLVYSESDESRKQSLTKRLKKLSYEDSNEDINNIPMYSREDIGKGRHFIGRHKRQVDYMTYNTQSESQNLAKKYIDNFVIKGPKMLNINNNKRRHRKGKKNRKNHDPNDPMMGFGQESEEINEKNIDSSIKNDNNPDGVKLLDGKFYDTQKCGKKTLKVKFSDIGWGSKVIAPKIFEANYCSGSCSFPLTRDTRHSNHAIIQSLLYNLKVIPNVPNVCCAAESMDSLTILYFDEQDNVVLKTYPKMSVTSCACL